MAYDYSGIDPDAARARIESGPRDSWRYADFLPFAEALRTSPAAGVSPLVRADCLAERPQASASRVKNEAANLTHSFKDRVVTALAKARELKAGSWPAPPRATSPTPPPTPPRPAWSRTSSSCPTSRSRRSAATGVYGTHSVGVEGSYDDVNRLCTELAADRPWAFLNVNVRPLLREGSKTLAFEIAEQLAVPARPRGRAHRPGSPSTGSRGLRGVALGRAR